MVIGHAAHRDDPRGLDDAGVEGRAVPAHAGHLALPVDCQAQRVIEAEELAFGHARLVEGIGLVPPDQAIAAALDPAERGGLAGRFEAGAQEGGPVMAIDAVERGDDILEPIGDHAPVAGADAEEGAGEIVDALPSAGASADDLVDLEPDQRAFGIVVLVAGQRGIGLGLAPGEDRVLRRVLDRAPPAARLFAEPARPVGELAQDHVLRLQARPCRVDQAPELGLAFIDPQEVALHRLAVVGRPESGRPAELAVPAMRELMG